MVKSFKDFKNSELQTWDSLWQVFYISVTGGYNLVFAFHFRRRMFL